MKCSSETLQNLLYFMYKKSHVLVFLFFHFVQFYIFTFMNALVYVDIDKGIHKGKSKVAQNEKRKKICGFSYT